MRQKIKQLSEKNKLIELRVIELNELVGGEQAEGGNGAHGREMARLIEEND